MRVFVQFGVVVRRAMSMQLVNRVLVVVLRFLARRVDVRMRVLVRVGMLVSMRVHHPVCVRVLVGMYMRMNVRVRVFVLDLISHRVLLLKIRTSWADRCTPTPSGSNAALENMDVISRELYRLRATSKKPAAHPCRRGFSQRNVAISAMSADWFRPRQRRHGNHSRTVISCV
jgi:hypothetical protein